MGEGWQLMQIRGIPLRVHPSWFIILVVFTLVFQQQAAVLPEASSSPVLSCLRLETMS